MKPEPRLYEFPGSSWERANTAWERVNGAVLTVQAPGIFSFCIKRIAKSKKNH
ncbi:hypothetical protein AVDCRST_MAG84-2547 [uncultured Microcoleus sp.]|uniref:Uncharacterized protein n=1 Tax=uncultured Microcoleus sp. TaxID=259945 RepID=A0A6J4LX53_9CYAN|nr:hypothetical protein AVDCRST_MAG84-2547 [uncultured Microcoleus sp.]